MGGAARTADCSAPFPCFLIGRENEPITEELERITMGYVVLKKHGPTTLNGQWTAAPSMHSMQGGGLDRGVTRGDHKAADEKKLMPLVSDLVRRSERLSL